MLHSLPTGYVVDDAIGVRNPRGMIAHRFGIDMHVVTTDVSVARNLMLVVERCHLHVEAMVASPYVAGLSTLADDGVRRRIRATAGDTISIPSGTPHGYANAGEAPALVLAMFDRSMERFFRAVGASPGNAPVGPPGPEVLARVMAAAEAHGIRILVQPPAPTTA